MSKKKPLVLDRSLKLSTTFLLLILAKRDGVNKKSPRNTASDKDVFSRLMPYLIAIFPLYVISFIARFKPSWSGFEVIALSVWFVGVVLTYLYYARKVPARIISGMSTALANCLALGLAICTLIILKPHEFDPENTKYYEKYIHGLIRLWAFLFASAIGIILPTARARTTVKISHEREQKEPQQGLSAAELADAIKPLRDWLVSFLWLTGLLALTALANRFSGHFEDHAETTSLGIVSLGSTITTLAGFVFITGLIKLSSDNRSAFIKAMSTLDEKDLSPSITSTVEIGAKKSYLEAAYLLLSEAICFGLFVLVGWFVH